MRPRFELDGAWQAGVVAQDLEDLADLVVENVADEQAHQVVVILTVLLEEGTEAEFGIVDLLGPAIKISERNLCV